MQMQDHTPPLVKLRRKLLRTFPYVFIGSEAIIWAAKNLKLLSEGNYQQCSTNFRYLPYYESL